MILGWAWDENVYLDTSLQYREAKIHILNFRAIFSKVYDKNIVIEWESHTDEWLNKDYFQSTSNLD